jgi:hypothetical protein
MKKAILLAVMVCLVAACKKNTQQSSESIVGKWKRSAWLADPGDGSGRWNPADPSNPGYLQFNVGGTVSFSPPSIYDADHYRLPNDSTIIFLRGSENFQMEYHISGTLLTLTGGCIEPCGTKYIKAE